MIVTEESRRPEPKGQRPTAGWTSLHSWIFLVIVALGLILIGTQNRYHYLSPLGLGKAYRIDRVFGGIQEFDPASGWIKAQLASGPPPQAVTMMPPAGPPTSVPPATNVPPGAPPQIATSAQPDVPPAVAGERQPPLSVPREEPVGESPRKEVAAVPEPAAPSVKPEMTSEEKFAAFKKEFPDFGKDEFLLANDDLYPDWKKNLNPNGTWQEFLGVYQDFIQWWNDSGSPPEAGFKLWKDYLKSKGH